jgi:hypothetical protein
VGGHSNAKAFLTAFGEKENEKINKDIHNYLRGVYSGGFAVRGRSLPRQHGGGCQHGHGCK